MKKSSISYNIKKIIQPLNPLLNQKESILDIEDINL
jgi:hypothetical protein